MTLHDSNDTGEPKARAVAKFLGREERIENLLHVLRRNSHARVSHFKAHMRSCFCAGSHAGVVLIHREIFGRQRERAAGRNRVTCIYTKVEQDLMKLGRVAYNRPERFGIARSDRDLFRKGFFGNLSNVLDQGRGLETYPFSLSAARKG